MIDEVDISRAIAESYMKDLLDCMSVDVAIGGAGPSGMIAAYYLAKNNYRVAIFERSLSAGGGMWGGGMMFSRIAVQEEAKPIINEFGIHLKRYRDIYIADALETAASFCSKAIRSGVKIFNLMDIEDVMVRKERIEGLVLNWSPVKISNLHVDPLCVKAKVVIDTTGHDAEIAKIVERKMGKNLRTETGGVIGEKSMWAEVGEEEIIQNTREVYPGLIVAGMAANATCGSPRMGAIFGGMLLSGKRAAEIAMGLMEI
jgi:thiazole biosynthesis enzyme